MSSGRKWVFSVCVSRESCSSATSGVTRTFPKPTSVACGPDVLKVRSLNALFGLRVGGDVHRAERPFTVQGLPALWPYAALLRIRAMVCCWWCDSPFRECSTSKQQLQYCRCGGNHTDNYRGCVKWMEAKAAHPAVLPQAN